MNIGDWVITIQKDVDFRTIPGDPNSILQKMITYDFHYVPQNYHLVRTITFIKPYDDVQVLAFLTDFAAQLKTTFIDTRVL